MHELLVSDSRPFPPRPRLLAVVLLVLTMFAASCGSSEPAEPAPESGQIESTTDQDDQAAGVDESASADASLGAVETDPVEAPNDDAESVPVAAVGQTFTVDVWADNWFVFYVNGALIGQDSVSIETERSFNKETFAFEATLPLTIAVQAKDFKETDSGIEYIGEPNQQMGDGGLIVQIRDSDNRLVAATNASWTSFVVHEAPLDKACENSANPDSDCGFLITPEPDGWRLADFDDSGWPTATAYSEAEVSPKDGYDEVTWDPLAQLIWGNDLETNNTVLFRTVIAESPLPGWTAAEALGEPAPPEDGGDRPAPAEGAEQPPPPEDGEQPAPPEDGERPAPPEDGERPAPPEDGAEQPAPPEDGAEQPAPPEDGAEQPAPPEDGAEQPAPPEDGERPAPPEDGGDRPPPPEDGERPPRPEGDN